MESLAPNFERASTLSRRVILGKRQVCSSNVVVLQNTLRVYGFAVFYQGRADAHGVFGSLAWWLTRARRVTLATPVQHEPFCTTTTIPARGADPRDVSLPFLSLIINAVQRPLVAQSSSRANRVGLDPPRRLARCM
jgi:hypothetical protein